MPGKLIITRALYYTKQHSIDVTDAIRKRVMNNTLNIMASNDIAGDPQVGVVKTLAVDYVLDGVERRAEAVEGKRLLIPAASQTKHFTDIIIPSYENDQLTAACFESIKRYTKPGTYRVIWVDNGSTSMELAAKELEGVNRICVYLPENKGFVGAVNEGLRLSDAPAVCLLNNDTVVTDGWLDKLTNTLYANPKLGIVGALTGYGQGQNVDSHHSLSLHSGLLPEDAREWSFDEINKELEKSYRGKTYPVDFVAFLCALIKREVIDKVGFLDSNYEMGLYDDNDYNIAAQKAGYEIALCIDTCIYHRGRSTFNLIQDTENFDVDALLKKNRKYMVEKWSL